MEYQYINFEKQDSVARIIFNRPEVYHSVNRGMALEIQAALSECAADDVVRCVVIRGTGKAFCAGQDLKEVIDPNGPELKHIVRDHYNPIILQVRNLEKPVICAVNGVAAGAGANLALCGDIVVASSTASFVQAFSKIGLIPDSGGTYFLPRLIGWQRAAAIMMRADKITSAEAEKMGMIYKTYEADVFDAEVEKLAAEFARMATTGLALTKKALNASAQNTLEQQLALEEQLQTIAGQTEDFREGVAAFLEKRAPKFAGK